MKNEDIALVVSGLAVIGVGVWFYLKDRPRVSFESNPVAGGWFYVVFSNWQHDISLVVRYLKDGEVVGSGNVVVDENGYGRYPFYAPSESGSYIFEVSDGSNLVRVNFTV